MGACCAIKAKTKLQQFDRQHNARIPPAVQLSTGGAKKPRKCKLSLWRNFVCRTSICFWRSQKWLWVHRVFFRLYKQANGKKSLKHNKKTYGRPKKQLGRAILRYEFEQVRWFSLFFLHEKLLKLTISAVDQWRPARDGDEASEQVFQLRPSQFAEVHRGQSRRENLVTRFFCAAVENPPRHPGRLRTNLEVVS